jgi:hypothetical protein
MKYIKKYKLFIEADEFDIQTTDTRILRWRKRKWTLLRSNLLSIRQRK